jgi:hypothetical protein
MNPAPPPNPASDQWVYVPVPADRVDDVFRFLLGSPAESDAAEEADLDRLVERVFRESDEKFRSLLVLLADYPDQPLSTGAVADDLKLYRGTASLAGMLGAFGRRTTNRYGDFWPFERFYDPAKDESQLVMSAKVAKIVERLAEI